MRIPFRGCAWLNLAPDYNPWNPGYRLLYSNKPDFMCGMIDINTLMYVAIRLNSEAPYVRS